MTDRQEPSSWKDRARELEAQDRLRRRREGIIIAVLVIVLVAALFIGMRVSGVAGNRFAPELISSRSDTAFWGLITILVFVLVFLVIRNLVKLFFERRRRIFGAHLRARLVAAFILLSLGPAVVLFILGNFFINRTVERWFDPAVNNVFETSKEIVRNTYQMVGENTLHFAKTLSEQLTEDDLLPAEDMSALKKLLERKRQEDKLDAIEVFDREGKILFRVKSPAVEHLPKAAKGVVDRGIKGYEGYYPEKFKDGELVRGIAPIYLKTEDERQVAGVVVMTQYLGAGLAKQLDSNRAVFNDYDRLKKKESGIRWEFRAILILITLTVVFLSIWFGLYFAKGITVPIQLLAEGTQEIASGNLDYRIEMDATDEVGTLVKSFNKMTGDLKHSREMLEQRRIYIETLLANIDSGVIATDPEGIILTVNQAALLILDKPREKLVGNFINSALSGELAEAIEDAEPELLDQEKRTAVRQVFYQSEDRRSYLRISCSLMTDSSGRRLGKVFLIDDLTDLVRAQRSIAWREVARRIAHEIKNPLTPIQLSAQRLLRKYESILGDKSEVLKECTSMIASQVDEMKRLVDEFSNFARLPSLQLGSHQLNEVLEEALALYKQAHPQIEFKLEQDASLPAFEFDRDQIKRAIINLVDNAIQSFEGKPGQITLKSRHFPETFSAQIIVADTGKGIPRDIRKLIFEPYYSGRGQGIGLGLAIVQRIVNDHYGRIQVEDNQPKGTRFIIDLPTRVKSAGSIAKESAS